MRGWTILLACVVAWAGFAACAHDREAGAAHGHGEGEEEEAAGVGALEGEWALVMIDGAEVEVRLPSPPTIRFEEDGTVSGSSGVNRYTTRADLEQIASGRLSLGPTAGTRMAGPPAAMEVESGFLERLGAVTRYSIEGERLVLHAGDDPALAFERINEEDMEY